jgi:ketosteroid isomerase-like protein
MLYLIFLLVDVTMKVTNSPDSVQVKKADIELNELILKKDAKRAAHFYADDFILTTSSGVTKYKQTMLDEIASKDLSLQINETVNVEVRMYESTAVLTGVLHQKGIYKGKEFDVWMLVTDTWVETSSGWKILSGHASPQPKNIRHEQ